MRNHAPRTPLTPFILIVLSLTGPPGSQAEDWTGQFVAPQDLHVDLFADESQVADPVALCLDDQGRVYVAETGRALRGVEENRRGDEWLNDDLALESVEDRLEMYRKWADQFEGGLGYFSQYADQLRRLEDVDGDGRADQASIFAGGFNDPLDGLAAGVIARRGDVYFACVPKLYLLRDDDQNGCAEQSEVLHHGFGIRHAFYGHDLHGLVWGPDGKLYFSMGDRGFHVVTREGQTLHSPDRGAVLRCNADGSQLEVFATGLRNPQEIAFDQFGNLFTGDNNSDAGDKARLVYLPEGSDSGWRMTYQYMEDPYLRGPWTEEKMWHPQHEGQPASMLPPAAWIGGGPSGLTYYPGVGLPDRYQQHFFLCDYHADSSSTIDAFTVEPRGAGFALANHHHFLQHINASDVEFGYDGRMYVADFISGWDVKGQGRIFTVHAPKQLVEPIVGEITRLFAEGFQQRNVAELADLLAHPDMRVRLRAQFALAERGTMAIEPLQIVADQSKHRLARLHAIWGLGQIGAADSSAVKGVVRLLEDGDVEVRANAVRVLGDCRYQGAAQRLVELLRDDSLRVRALAAQAVGKLGNTSAVAPLLAMLEENGDADVFLRHAAVMGLTGVGDVDRLLAHADHPSRSVRLGILLTLRRLENDRLSRYLNDADPFLVAEAASAIHDLPLPNAMPQLAALIDRYMQPIDANAIPRQEATDAPDDSRQAWPLMRRVLNANFRLGKGEHAQALARFAASRHNPSQLRSLALQRLAQWAEPPARDAVLGHLQHLSKRDRQALSAALQPVISRLLSNTSGDLRSEATRLAASLGIEVDTNALVGWLRDKTLPTNTRVESLRLLASQDHGDLIALLDMALEDHDPQLRSEARELLAHRDVDRAIGLLTAALDSHDLGEQQRALSTLAGIAGVDADRRIEDCLERLIGGELPPPLQLDALEAARRRDTPALREKISRYEASLDPGDPLAPYRWALEGGNQQRGEFVFFNKTEVQCQRCHKIDPRGGGETGPELSDIGRTKNREYLLESLIAPNRTMAGGYQYAVLITDDGRQISGRVLEESAETVRLQMEGRGEVVIPTETIEERSSGLSAMPANLIERLTPGELRDLVAFLAALRKD